jgi:hypothetical protein
VRSAIRRRVRRDRRPAEEMRSGAEDGGDQSELDAAVAPLAHHDPTFLRYMLRNLEMAERVAMLECAEEVRLYTARLSMISPVRAVSGRPTIPPILLTSCQCCREWNEPSRRCYRECCEVKVSSGALQPSPYPPSASPSSPASDTFAARCIRDSSDARARSTRDSTDARSGVSGTSARDSSLGVPSARSPFGANSSGIATLAGLPPSTTDLENHRRIAEMLGFVI